MKGSDPSDKGNGRGREAGVSPETGEAAGDPSEAARTEEITLSRDEYDALNAEVARLKDQYLRAVADFDNYRKRSEREKADIVCFANERLVGELLPILDNLQRALSMKLDQAGVESILEGVRMVSGQLHSILNACGLEPVQAVGGPFDPQQHEAVGVLPSREHDEGTVVSELQRGYKFKGKVLRPSMVHVAGQPSEDEEDGSRGGS